MGRAQIEGARVGGGRGIKQSSSLCSPVAIGAAQCQGENMEKALFSVSQGQAR